MFKRSFDFNREYFRIKKSNKCIFKITMTYFDALKFTLIITTGILLFFLILFLITSGLNDIRNKFFFIFIFYFVISIFFSIIIYYSDRKKREIYENYFINLKTKEIINMEDIISIKFEKKFSNKIDFYYLLIKLSSNQIKEYEIGHVEYYLFDRVFQKNFPNIEIIIPDLENERDIRDEYFKIFKMEKGIYDL